MRAPLTLAIAAALLLAMSCDGTTAPQRHGQPSHLFRADAATIHDSLYSFCGIEGELPVQRLSLPPWNGQGTVTLYRWVATTHGVITPPSAGGARARPDGPHGRRALQGSRSGRAGVSTHGKRLAFPGVSPRI